MPKSPDAFRTISEVADWLDVQAHVLRFWESKFSQVKPIKRAGGRRYYRPADMLLLGGIKKLLHEDGLTIKGVQKILREEGMGHVSDMSAPLDDQLIEMEEAAQAPEKTIIEEETAVVLDFAPAEAETEADNAPAEAEAPEAVQAEAPPDAPPPDVAEPEAEETSALPDFVQQPLGPEAEAAETDNLPAAEDSPEPVEVAEAKADEPAEEEQEIAAEDTPAPEPEPKPEPEPETKPREPAAEAPAPAPMPRIIDMPPLTPEAEIAAAPSTLTAAFRLPGLSAAQAGDVAPLLQELTVLRDRMQGARRGGAAKG